MLLDHAVVLVLGKGGVGRTTLTAALGLAAVALGKRACVVELEGQGALPAKFGLQGTSFAFRTAAPGVDVWTVSADECLEDFAARKLKLPAFARQVVRNRFVTTFLDAVPGMSDLLVLGKIENLVREPQPTDPRFDVLIIDAPATGHGLTLLQAARTMTEMTRAGPFHDLAATIETFIADPALTAVALATLPEALPVQETLELARRLTDEGFPPRAVLFNGQQGSPIPTPPGLPATLAALSRAPNGTALAALCQGAADRAVRHAQARVALLEGLDNEEPPAILAVPRVVDVDPVPVIAQALAAALGASP